MMTGLIFLGGFFVTVTTPGLIALHLEDRRKANGAKA